VFSVALLPASQLAHASLFYAGRCNLKVVTWKMNCQFILHPFTIIQAYKKSLQLQLSPINAIWNFFAVVD
jgi:hypothetical protein